MYNCYKKAHWERNLGCLSVCLCVMLGLHIGESVARPRMAAKAKNGWFPLCRSCDHEKLPVWPGLTFKTIGICPRIRLPSRFEAAQPSLARYPTTTISFFSYNTRTWSQYRGQWGLDWHIQDGRRHLEWGRAPRWREGRQEEAPSTTCRRGEGARGVAPGKYLYDRSLNEYRNKPRKYRVRAEKGATLNHPLPGDDIGRWIKGMRTSYGKLTKLKSGSGSKTIT